MTQNSNSRETIKGGNCARIPIISRCLRTLLPTLLSLLGCHSTQTSVGGSLDPLPVWYDAEFRDSVYSFFNREAELPMRRYFTSVSIREIHLLAWQQYSFSRPLVDSNDLCYQAMIWIHLVTPETEREGWALARVWGRPGGWRLTQAGHVTDPIVIYDRPPTNADIYTAETWLHPFEMQTYWPVYDGYLRVNTWEALLGEKPTRPFDVRRRGD